MSEFKISNLELISHFVPTESKIWMRLDGTIAEIADDTVNFGDTRIVNEKFPICDHCGEVIFDTQFGCIDMSGKTLTLCYECDEEGHYTSTKYAQKIKKKDKGFPVKQRCCGESEKEVNGIIYPVWIG